MGKRIMGMVWMVAWIMVSLGLVNASFAVAQEVQDWEETPQIQPTSDIETVADVVLFQWMPGGGTEEPAGAQLNSTSLLNYTIYEDRIPSAGWTDWSWSADRNMAQTQIVHGGHSAIGLSYRTEWGGFYLHAGQAIRIQTPACLRLWAHGGPQGAQKLSVVVNLIRRQTITLSSNRWSYIEIPLAESNGTLNLQDVAFQEYAGQSRRPFYIDDLTVGPCGANPTPTPAPSATPTPRPGPTATMTPVPGITPEVSLSVDAGAERLVISPYIYGINFGEEVLANELRVPIRRWGGNATTRYNWKLDTSNKASDWFFENIPNPHPHPDQLPLGSSSDRFIEQNQRTNTASFLTVPMIGWTAKSRNIDCAFSVRLYGAQQKVDPWRTDCGNGVRLNGSYIDNNPDDQNREIDDNFVKQWINHLTARYRPAAQGGVRFYSLDNEPMLWHVTHRDVHPDPVGYDELRDLTYEYGAAVKRADPTALVTGPAFWGWPDYFYSAIDTTTPGNWWANPPDRNAHGGTPLAEWYLQQMRAYEQAHGVRILDYLDVHFYPQAQGVALAPVGNDATQALRLRSTRALWDPTYRDESWVNDAVQLIPRMKSWVAANYPGTKVALTEYNWGALDSLNGALAQADILGIFGREGLDMAMLWDPPDLGEPGAFAFRIYRNYDGNGAAFGETSVRAESTDQDKVAIYAAQRTGDRALTLVLVNKTNRDVPVTLSLAGANLSGTMQVYRYSNANLNAIVRLSDLPVQRSVGMTVPAASITLLVVPVAP